MSHQSGQWPINDPHRHRHRHLSLLLQEFLGYLEKNGYAPMNGTWMHHQSGITHKHTFLGIWRRKEYISELHQRFSYQVIREGIPRKNLKGKLMEYHRTSRAQCYEEWQRGNNRSRISWAVIRGVRQWEKISESKTFYSLIWDPMVWSLSIV